MTLTVSELMFDMIDALAKIPAGSQDRRPDETYEQWSDRVVAPALGLDVVDEAE
jgi:hypothetical protein